MDEKVPPLFTSGDSRRLRVRPNGKSSRFYSRLASTPPPQKKARPSLQHGDYKVNSSCQSLLAQAGWGCLSLALQGADRREMYRVENGKRCINSGTSCDREAPPSKSTRVQAQATRRLRPRKPSNRVQIEAAPRRSTCLRRVHTKQRTAFGSARQRSRVSHISLGGSSSVRFYTKRAQSKSALHH